MKIISKFQDYYDRALAFGQDNRIPYVRLTQEIPLAELSLPTAKVLHSGYLKTPKLKPGQHPYLKELKFKFNEIFVCGKTYRYACITTAGPGYREGRYFGKHHVEYFWSYDQFCKFVESFGFLVQDIYSGRMFGQTPEYAQIESFLSAQATVEHEAELIEKRIVVLRIGLQRAFLFQRLEGQEYWEHNFPLKDVQFYKLMDPYQIYQELDMYVTGVLGQQAKETITISDKDRIYQHGFDKYSFRKLPEEGKRKK